MDTSELTSFDEQTFKQALTKSLEQLKLVLENEKRPKLASDVPHTYESKFQLAEVSTNILP